MVTLGASASDGCVRWRSPPARFSTKPKAVGSTYLRRSVRPQKLRVSANGTVWLLTWGRTAMSHWDGSRWRYDKETDRGTKTTFRDGTFALDGDQVWMPSEQCVLHWDGQRWNSYTDVKPAQGASIVAGDGQVWIADHTGNLFHFEKGKWTTKKLSLPGMRSGPDPEAGSPELARTSDGTVWLVSERLWRLHGDIGLPVIADGKLLDQVTLIGVAGDRLWLSDASGIRWISKDTERPVVYFGGDRHPGRAFGERYRVRRKTHLVRDQLRSTRIRRLALAADPASHRSSAGCPCNRGRAGRNAVGRRDDSRRCIQKRPLSHLSRISDPARHIVFVGLALQARS